MERTYNHLNTKDDPPVVENNEEFYFRYEPILFTRGLFPGANSDVCFAISMNHKQLGWKRAQQSERWPSFARRESETAFGGFRSIIGGTHVLIEVFYRELKEFERQEKVFIENSRHNLETPKAGGFEDPGKFHKLCRRVQHRSHASLQQHNSNSTSQLNFICCKWWEKDEDLWAGYAST